MHDPPKTQEAAVAFRRHSHLLAEHMTEPAATPANLPTHVRNRTDVRSLAEYLKRAVHGRMYGFFIPLGRQGRLQDAQPFACRHYVSQSFQKPSGLRTPNQIERDRSFQKLKR